MIDVVEAISKKRKKSHLAPDICAKRLFLAVAMKSKARNKLALDQSSRLRGAKRLSGGGAKFGIKHKTHCFLKSKFVD